MIKAYFLQFKVSFITLRLVVIALYYFIVIKETRAHMGILSDTYTLNTGAKIPKIGFGTWLIPDGDEAYNSVASALKAGYRHIDTARVYGNEASVGKAIKDSGISREEIFLTTKLPADIKDASRVKETFETSLSALGASYVDLYLIHAPWPWQERDSGIDYTKENIEVWQEMEKIYDSGRAKAIGVSNFNILDLTAILNNGKIVPAANQIKWFIGFTEDDITKFSQSKGILVEAYSPLSRGGLLDNADLKDIAKKYGKTVAQLSIRYCLQHNTLPLPKSTHEQYMAENADVDFEISSADMAMLDSLKTE